MIGLRRKRRPRPVGHGTHVRVISRVGGNHDNGQSFSVRGETGQVIGANPHYTNEETGERMTAVQLDDGGAIVAVPRRALRAD